MATNIENIEEFEIIELEITENGTGITSDCSCDGKGDVE